MKRPILVTKRDKNLNKNTSQRIKVAAIGQNKLNRNVLVSTIKELTANEVEAFLSKA